MINVTFQFQALRHCRIQSVSGHYAVSGTLNLQGCNQYLPERHTWFFHMMYLVQLCFLATEPNSFELALFLLFVAVSTVCLNALCRFQSLIHLHHLKSELFFISFLWCTWIAVRAYFLCENNREND